MTRYSSNLAGDFKAFYEQATDDSENCLLQQQSEIALIEAQIKVLLNSGIQCGDTWKRLEQATSKLKDYAREGKTDKLQNQLTVVLKIIDEGVQLSANRLEVNQLIKVKSKLIELEVKRLALAREHLSREQAITFVTGLLDSVRRHVDDPNVLKTIAADFTKSMATLQIKEI